MTKILYGGDPLDRQEWCDALRQACPQAEIYAEPEAAPLDEIDILLYEPTGPITDFAPFTKLAAIQSLWAGVEVILAQDSLPAEIPLLRMVEPGLRKGMSEYILGHVMRLHLGMDAHKLAQSQSRWEHRPPSLAREKRVGILGLGELGQDAARVLKAVGFEVLGWSRSRKEVAGVESYVGESELSDFLRQSEILVILLPLTPHTDKIINAERLQLLPAGAAIINAGRGPLIDDEALLSALASGHIGNATLDVFATEPLPAAHPFWTHPHITVTPHIASVTRRETAAEVVAKQIERFESGKSFLYSVDRSRGY